MTVYFRVRNWDKFQHYKDRAPPWIKLHRDLLTSRTWVSGDDASRALAIACMLLAAATDNKIPADPVYVRRVAYLNADPDFSRLAETDFIEFIDENGNVLADASSALANCTKRSPEERREEERRGEAEPRPSDASATPRKKLHEDIIAAYHEICTALPSVKTWPDRRRKKLEACITERVGQGKPADTVAYWQALFRKVAASDWLCGQNPRGWRADLEWLCEPKHFAKLIEGGYDNNTTNGVTHHGRSYASAGPAALS